MSVVFADTSALIKRYVPETGSPWVRSWFAPGQDVIVAISELTIVELSSAMARREREGSIPLAIAATLRTDIVFHIEHIYLVVRLHSDIINEASRLVSDHPIRTLDAVQLAAAKESIGFLGTIPAFISADLRLLAAAALEGFPTDNPSAH